MLREVFPIPSILFLAQTFYLFFFLGMECSASKNWILWELGLTHGKGSCVVVLEFSICGVLQPLWGRVFGGLWAWRQGKTFLSVENGRGTDNTCLFWIVAVLVSQAWNRELGRARFHKRQGGI